MFHPAIPFDHAVSTDRIFSRPVVSGGFIDLWFSRLKVHATAFIPTSFVAADFLAVAPSVRCAMAAYRD